MSTITTIQSTDVIANSRTDINTNFSNLNTDKIETSYLDTDTALAANSDTKIATQKAVKAYADALASPTGKSWNEYAVDSVGTDSYAITVTGLTSYVAGQTFKFKAGTANTGACTLNVNSLGAKSIYKDVSSELATGDILANQIVTVIYDGTNMQLVSVISGTLTGTGGILPTTKGGTGSSIFAFKNGSTTYDISTANGTQNIAHGLGRIPNKVKITAVMIANTYAIFTTTVYNGTTQSSLFMNKADTAEEVGTTFRIIDGAGAYVEGVVTYDATNVSIAWTKTGNPTGTANLVWEAE